MKKKSHPHRIQDFSFGMDLKLTAEIHRDGEWYVGFCPEVPEANGQGKTSEECVQNLKEAILLLMEDRREDAARKEGCLPFHHSCAPSGRCQYKVRGMFVKGMGRRVCRDIPLTNIPLTFLPRFRFWLCLIQPDAGFDFGVGEADAFQGEGQVSDLGFLHEEKVIEQPQFASQPDAAAKPDFNRVTDRQV